MRPANPLRLRLLVTLCLGFGCSTATMGGMLASLHAAHPETVRRGAGEARRSTVAIPALCGRGHRTVEWICPGPVTRVA